ncbi:hypothetical protein C5167_016721 [Papaver somniferum]|uniref:pectinesterase-like n=1 Tax=Papaver somniferum TaxID=3469 RepID=UPI000E6FE1D5|nr:pectinesterase-like [Papaver somniferum]RZC94025.1 hypothetical protein C5167_016721 [Papaver somniferum]
MHNLSNIMRILLSILAISSLLLLLLSSTTTTNKAIITKKIHNVVSKSSPLHVHDENLQVAHSNCEGTLYPELCISTLASLFPGTSLKRKSIAELISGIINHTVDIVKISASNCTGIKNKFGSEIDTRENRALDDCLELFEDTILDLSDALSDLQSRNTSAKRYHHLQTLFSASMTNQFTCLDGFFYSKGKIRKQIEKRLYRISQLVSNSLVMLEKIPKEQKKTDQQVFPEYGEMVDGFPRWVTRKDRRLLQASTNATAMSADLVVAKDGSGNFTTISEAVEAAPKSSTKRFVIYIKEGGYFENVEVVKKKTMLMFIGDGIGKTVVKAHRNVVDGWTTFRSATVAVMGKGFIARDMTFENSAGPSKHQAVALRSGADLSAFYRCSFVGYQDTLYAHSLRQFYKECDVYGTVDFVFGNAAVVLQDSNLYARKPNPNQKNIFTAQGREDPNQNTGISILNCKVTAAADLIPFKSEFQTYLGRPWRQYSRTVYLNSLIDDVVDPRGWLEWDGDFALSTLYYGEYMNRGPGANTISRVNWPGYRVINSSMEANQFTAESFIQVSDWLPSDNIPFYSGLN